MQIAFRAIFYKVYKLSKHGEKLFTDKVVKIYLNVKFCDLV